MSGEANLLDAGHAQSLDKLRDLFEAFSSKRDMLHLLEKVTRADGIQIFIGREAGYHPLDDYAMVSASYLVDSQVERTVGVLAVVGPTRMDYERVIPTVDITARVLSAALRNT